MVQTEISHFSAIMFTMYVACEIKAKNKTNKKKSDKTISELSVVEDLQKCLNINCV